MKEEFDSLESAFEWVAVYFQRKLTRWFEFHREGWEYAFDRSKIFVESIESLRPTIEIEAESEAAVKRLFERLGIEEVLSDPVPELMRKLKGYEKALF